VTSGEGADWPSLPYGEWRDTLDTLHMELQVLGKIRVACSPKEPEWAHVALYVSPRGITTGPVPSPSGLFEVEADLVAHEVVVRTTSGDVRTVPLVARPVSEFYAELVRALRAVGVDAELSTMPQEVEHPIPFPDDTVHHTYQPEYAARFWRILTLVTPVFDEYRAAFRGKVSRTQFFWGSMDLNVTRFSGRPCTPPPGADLLLRGSYDYEQLSVGFWPGTESFPEPAFYAYAYPKPEGMEHAAIAPAPAGWDDGIGEFVLRYADARAEPSPAAALREFLDAAYDAGARIAGWDSSLCD
jgi:Family of unknown function (DUF5996)